MSNRSRKLPNDFPSDFRQSKNSGIGFTPPAAMRRCRIQADATRLLAADEQLLRAEVAAMPDITLAELSATVAVLKNQPKVSLSTLSEELRRLGLPRKKR